MFFGLAFCWLLSFADVHETDSLRKLLTKELNGGERADVLNALSNRALQESDSSFWFFNKQAIELSSKASYAKGLGIAYLLRAQALEGVIGNDSIEKIYKQSISSLDAAELPGKKAHAINLLGILYERMGRYRLALGHYFKAYMLFKQVDDKIGEANCINNIGLVYQLQKDYAHALVYFKQAIRLGKELNNVDVLANAYNNLAICYQETHQPKLAKDHFLKVLEIDLEQGIPSNLALSYNNLGVVESDLGNYSKAKNYYLDAIKLKLEALSYTGLCNTYGNLGTVYYKLGQIDSARYFLNKAVKLGVAEGAYLNLLEVYKAYAELEEDVKNHPEAIKWYKKFNVLSDSINKADALGQLKQLEKEYSILDKEISTTRIEKEKENESLRVKLFGVSFFLVFASLVLLAFYSVRIKKANKNLNLKQRKIEVQNKILQVKNIEILQSKEAAEEAANVKAQFISTISHEIRTPLNAIIGVTNLLQSGRVLDEQKENLNILKISSDNLLSLVNNILDFSKLEAGKMHLEHIDFNLRNMVYDVKDLFSLKAGEKGIELLVDFDENIPPVIKGDPLRINQLLINLVNNAIKFTEKGFVKIEVSLQLSTINHALIYFSISDSGIGIPANKQSQIFNSFTQADANTTRKFGGTGLGLSICKRILENLNSKLQLDSTIGMGSTFYFTINFEVSRNASPGKSAKTASFEDSIQGKRILVVEDNMMNIMVLRQFLQKWGVQVEVAMNGKEGIKKIKEQNFDAVLMDIHMPEMDGIEASLHIRSLPDERKRNVPILALTAENELQFRQKVYEVGMNDYIFKPFNPDDLKERLGYALYNAGNKSKTKVDA